MNMPATPIERFLDSVRHQLPAYRHSSISFVPLVHDGYETIVRHDCLWSREAAEGRAQGKDRPACLVAVNDSAIEPRFVVLLPVTHSAPIGDTVGIEIPAKVRQAIGLDGQPGWVVVSEYNSEAVERS
ncbi:MAG: hypothetical protein KF790_08655 [Steroidobacteraceae bacterium]|nr:hypothetical protein [Steroidobacteraceae bacterium]MCW5572902.1 hypothetical protein [Steroidobacteraceae bacterium]